jgi:CheY-like chemotaxis protein
VARHEDEVDEVLKSFRPQLIVLDLVLPRLGGLLLAKKLGREPATRDAAIISVSAFRSAEVEQAALEAGCAAYVSKPIDTRRFPSLIAEHLA